MMQSATGAIWTLAFLAAALSGSVSSQANDSGLCRQGEKTWFEATSKATDQYVSVCGAEVAKGNVAWLQFRMGTPEKLAIAWPKSHEGSAKGFTLRRYTRYRTTYLKFEFRIGDRDYAILEADVPDETPPYHLQLRIRKADSETDLAVQQLKPATKPLMMMHLSNHVRSLPYDE